MSILKPFVGYVLTEACRNKLLKAYPPSFINIRCHHITLLSSSSYNSEINLKEFVPGKLHVVTYHKGSNIEIFGVSSPYQENTNYPFGMNSAGIFHIVLSLDSSARMKDAQKLISKYVLLPKPILLDGKVELC